ncbi:hypothetical protein ACE7GA_14285 [Roseomonas sp. CCTCC AB2023176]|uniref:hypothetical protein n=1 Tax=Roseomonas sp. CCTCC AB2023176 TaxID=3342640 RepID=UPI0035E1551B
MDAEIYRDAGDAARDARRWAEAAKAYELYLTLRPDDAGIHVQHGHAVKEAGDPGAALAAYRRAEALSPADPDIPLQIGHALKLAGRHHAAMEAYARAVALDPGAANPWREWLALAVRATPPRRVSGTALDLSDLLAWHGRRRIPTGIQRVQWEVLAALPRAPPPPARCSRPAAPTTPTFTWSPLRAGAPSRRPPSCASGTSPAKPVRQARIKAGGRPGPSSATGSPAPPNSASTPEACF